MAVADLGDLVKPEGVKFEKLATVRDGDKGDYKADNHMLKIVARSADNAENVFD